MVGGAVFSCDVCSGPRFVQERRCLQGPVVDQQARAVVGAEAAVQGCPDPGALAGAPVPSVCPALHVLALRCIDQLHLASSAALASSSPLRYTPHLLRLCLFSALPFVKTERPYTLTPPRPNDPLLSIPTHFPGSSVLARHPCTVPTLSSHLAHVDNPMISFTAYRLPMC